MEPRGLIRRILPVLPLLLASFALASCGGGAAAESTASKPKDTGPPTSVEGVPNPPPFEPPPGAPPQRVVIKDVREGQGVEIRPGDQFRANYICLDYQTGEELEDSWRDGPFVWTWGTGNDLTKGWEIGLKGMRVGGRRILYVPSKLAYGDGDRAYFVELLEAV